MELEGTHIDVSQLPWVITQEKVEAAIQRIVEACSPRRPILFGSYVRGQTDRHSDLDVPVVTQDEVASPLPHSISR